MVGESTGIVWPISLARYAAQRREERKRTHTPDTLEATVRELSADITRYALRHAIAAIEHRAREERPRGGACDHAADVLDQVALDLRDLMDELTGP